MNDLQRVKMPQRPRRYSPGQILLARYSRLGLFVGLYWIFAIVFRLQNSAQYFFDGLGLTLVMVTLSAVFAHVVSGFFKNFWARFWVGAGFLILHLILYLSQMVYYSIFKQFYSVYSAGNAGQVLEFWEEILWGISMCLPYFLLYFALFGLYVVYSLVWEKRLPRLKKRYRYEKLFAAVAVQLVVTCLLVPCARDASSSYARFFGQEDLYTSYHTVGALKSFELDLLRLILPQAGGSEALDKTPSQLPEAPKNTQETPVKTQPQTHPST